MESTKLSVVIPVYQAELILDELVRQLTPALGAITESYEIILVDDRSQDASWQRILELCVKEPRIRGIRLSRNFGQHAAITAGLDQAQADWIIVMDCDLQDKPSEIPKLYAKALEGYDIVFARRTNRQDNFLKKKVSKLFYKVFSYFSGVEQDETVANFGIYSRSVIDSVNTMREPMRAFSHMARWVGFSKAYVDVEHGSRYEGKTSYNWSKLFRLAADIILSYSDKPLILIIKFGFLISSLSFLYALYVLYKYLSGQITVLGYTSILVAICFFSGIIILTLGLLGMYIGRIFDGIKARPLYIVDKTVN